MKILMNSHSGGMGGIARVVKNILLNKNDIFSDDTFIIVNPENSRLKGKKPKERHGEGKIYFSTYFEIEKKIFNNHVFDESLFRELNSEVIEYYSNIIKNNKPDLIIINGTYLYPWFLLQASKKYNIPVIIYYHGSISKEVISKNKKLNKNILLYEKTFFSKEYSYIFPSKLLKNYIEEIFGNKLKKSFIIPNSVPNYFFHFRNKMKISKKIKKIGFVMRRNDVKNKKFVIDLVKYITQNNLDYEVHLITDKDKNYILKETGITDKLLIRNHVPHEKLKDFFHKIDVLVSPSIFETYGNVAQECIATKTPVIVSSNMGVKETFYKIGLNELIFDFKEYFIEDFLVKLNEVLLLKISNANMLSLHKEVLTKNINQKRFNCFKKIVGRIK